MMPEVLFLGAQTPRSQAYLQAMAANTLAPEHVILFGKPGAALYGQAVDIPRSAFIPDLFMPEYDETPENTCHRAGWDVQNIEAAHVNDTLIREAVHSRAPRLIIYSGFGGQLVGDALLDSGARFLHLHAGRLPEYRGSTTLYYSLIKERHCAVSACLLEKGIDTGPIVAQRSYAAPPAGMDIDYVYDSVIRADLLIRVLTAWRDNDGFPPMITQRPRDGETYYVIHPVLKHLAVLALEQKEMNQ